eukprot:9512941-Lingulodinium_polyedra.AAC.1
MAPTAKPKAITAKTKPKCVGLVMTDDAANRFLHPTAPQTIEFRHASCAGLEPGSSVHILTTAPKQNSTLLVVGCMKYTGYVTIQIAD